MKKENQKMLTLDDFTDEEIVRLSTNPDYVGQWTTNANESSFYSLIISPHLKSDREFGLMLDKYGLSIITAFMKSETILITQAPIDEQKTKYWFQFYAQKSFNNNERIELRYSRMGGMSIGTAYIERFDIKKHTEVMSPALQQLYEKSISNLTV